MNIYQEELMDHYEHPRNQGEMERPDLEAKESNASCGDMVALALKFKSKKSKVKIVEGVGWRGLGCAVSMAAMSKMSEWLKGKSLAEIKKMSEEELLRKAIGWEVNPGRRKCLELAVKVVKRLVGESDKMI